MKKTNGDFKIPGNGPELSDNVTRLVKELNAHGWVTGINQFAPYGQMAIRPQGKTSTTSDVGYIEFRVGHVGTYGDSGLQNFIENYKF